MHRPACHSLAELPHHSSLEKCTYRDWLYTSVNETLLGMALMGNLSIFSQTIVFLNPLLQCFLTGERFAER